MAWPGALRWLALAALALLAAGCAETPLIYPEPPPDVHYPSGKKPAPQPQSQPTTPAPPVKEGPAPASEQDSFPDPDEIPPDILDTPDAIVRDEPKSATGNPDTYQVLGKTYHVLEDNHGFHQRGYASWYGRKFHGRRTSSGERYNMFEMTAAHKRLPIPSYARVTNLENGKSVVVRINDRGPFHSSRIIDLSYAAAAKLDMLKHGSALVELDALTPDDNSDQPPPVVHAPPPPAEHHELPPPRPRPGESQYLQAGAFSSMDRAVSFREKLSGFGFGPMVIRSEQRGGRWLYRVLIGPFANANDLDYMRTQMNNVQQRTIPVAD